MRAIAYAVIYKYNAIVQMKYLDSFNKHGSG